MIVDVAARATPSRVIVLLRRDAGRPLERVSPAFEWGTVVWGGPLQLIPMYGLSNDHRKYPMVTPRRRRRR